MLLEAEPNVPQIQDEPALEIALPQVFTQPPLTMLQRGTVRQVEGLARRVYQQHLQRNGTSVLGPDYQTLVNEFQPLFRWATACWDFVLSTEGCRFVPRHSHEKLYARGDFRPVTDREYSRMVHRVFRECVFAFVQGGAGQSLGHYLRAHFWDEVMRSYRRLETPPDSRQRRLTAYSYLRCSPYQFLNGFHDDLVQRILAHLAVAERQAIERYFLHFFTISATGDALHLPTEAVYHALHVGLFTLLKRDRLVYYLLRQIERY